MKRSRLLASRLLAAVVLAIAAPDVFAAISINDNNTHVDRGVLYTNQAYLTASGGSTPYTFVATGVPAGLMLNSNGTLSGVTCGSNGTFTVPTTATDSLGAVGNAANTKLIVNAAPAGGCSLSFSSPSVPNAALGVAYSTTITATGGTAPYTYSVASGSLPTGLSLSSGGVLSGTPTVAGSYSFSVLAIDSGGSNGAQSFTMTVTASAPVASSVSQTVSYNAGSASPTTITLSITGGATSVAVASAAAHGTATAAGTAITYTPTANYIGSDSFTYTATNTNGTSAPATASITISPPTISVTPATLPDATSSVAYLQAVSANGGSAPYTFSISSGAVPSGLTLSSGGSLSGTPTVLGTFNFTVRGTDSSSGTFATGTRTYTLTVNPAAPVANSVSQTVAYNAGSASATSITLSITGAATSVAVVSPAAHGTAVASGTSITYTPTANYLGSDSFTYTATNSGGTSAAATVSITTSSPTITVAPASLPAAGVGTSYSQAITASGGLASYAFVITSGSLPPGLSLGTGGTLSGTPTSSGTFNFTVQATDSSSGTAAAGSRAYALSVDPAVPVAGAVSQSVSYNSGSASATAITLSISGGTAASVSISTPAAHGTASASGTSVTYMPVANFIGSDSFSYTATNGGGTSSPGTVSITVSAPTLAISPSSLPAPTVGTLYSQSLSASGGLAPYTFALGAGSLPAGLSLSGAGVLSGTPTAAGSSSFTVSVTDSSTGAAATGSHAFTVTVNPIGVNAPTSSSFSQAAPYNTGSATSTVITPSLGGGAASSLAIAVSPSHGTAVVSGLTILYTPVAHYSGSDTFSFTASNSGGTSSASTISITVAAPVLTISPSSLPQATRGTAYSQSLSASGGLPPYAFSVSAGALPVGVTLSVGGLLSGTPTVSGTVNFTIAVTDSGLGTPGNASRAFAFVVADPSGTAPVAAPVTQAVPYQATAGSASLITLNLSGGSATSVTIASPPSHGMATASVTTISYTPAAGFAGTDSFTYIASNATGTSAPAMVTITVTAPVLTATVAVPSVDIVQNGSEIHFTPVTSSGGAGVLTYSVTPTLPAGLVLEANSGEIHGAPTVTTSAATYTMTITDASGQSTTRFFVMAVQAPVVVLTITPDALPAVRYATLMTVPLTAMGGVAPYQWQVSAGALPDGVTLSDAGVLSGKPRGNATFTILATDSLGRTGSRAFTLVVNPRPDPTQNASVRGQLTAQASLVRRLSEAQASNISAHLMQLRGGFEPCSNRGQVNLAAGNSTRAQTPATTPQAGMGASQSATSSSADGEGGQCLSDALFGSQGLALWTGGSIELGETGGTPDSRNRFRTQGLTVGLDYRLSEHLTGGVALGGGWDTTQIDAGTTRTRGRGRFASLYGSFARGPLLALDALVGYGSTRLDNRRWEELDAVLLDGRRESASWFGAVSASMQLRAASYDLQPFARVQHVRSTLAAYGEEGDTLLALSFDDSQLGTTSLASGFSVSRSFVLSDFTLRPALTLGYSHAFDRMQSQGLYYSDIGRDELATVDVQAAPRETRSGELTLQMQTLRGVHFELGYGYSSGSGGFVQRAYRASASARL